MIGAGPSVDAGLPSWKRLIEMVATTLEQGGCPEPALFRQMLDNNQYLDAMNRLERACTQERLIQAARAEIVRSVRPGRLHELLASLPFRAYLTTNFDLLQLEALRRQHRAPAGFENAPNDIRAVDLDALVSHVRLHGHFGDPTHLVLTPSQYHEVMHSPNWQYYRTWIRSVFALKRVIFIGYSVNDPDLQTLLAQVRWEIDRKLPHLAILPDVSQFDREELYDKYRIEVVTYKTANGGHDELRALLELLHTSLKGAGYRATATPQLLRDSTSLWMWYQGLFGPRAPDAAPVAIKALILGTVSALGPVSEAQVDDELQRLIAASPGRIAELAARAIADLVVEGLVNRQQAGLSLTDRGSDLAATASTRVKRLFDAAGDHFRAKVGTYQVPEAAQRAVGDAALEALVEAVIARGMDVRRMLGHSVGLGSFVELLRISGFSAERHGVQERAHTVAAVVAHELGRPADNVRLLIDYLARASACLAVLGMDPEGQRLRREFLDDRALILDSNVIIQLLALGSTDSGVVRDLVGRLTQLKCVLATTNALLAEAEEHLAWARRHVRQFGELSAQVLDAARGAGAYDHNAFLEGFVHWRAENADAGFESYERSVAPDGLRRAVEVVAGAKVLTLDDTAAHRLQADAMQRENVQAILDADRELGKGKRLARIDAEADVLTWLRLWPLLSDAVRPGGARRATLLSRSGFLRRATDDANLVVPEPVVVRPEVLAQYVWSIQPDGPPLGRAVEAVRSQYLQSVAEYVDASVFEQVFGPLIRESEEVLAQAALDPGLIAAGVLSGRDWRELRPLDRPAAAESVLSSARSRLHDLERKLEEEGREREQLQKDVVELQERTAKLQRIANYKEKQRARDRARHKGS